MTMGQVLGYPYPIPRSYAMLKLAPITCWRCPLGTGQELPSLVNKIVLCWDMVLGARGWFLSHIAIYYFSCMGISSRGCRHWRRIMQFYFIFGCVFAYFICVTVACGTYKSLSNIPIHMQIVPLPKCALNLYLVGNHKSMHQQLALLEHEPAGWTIRQWTCEILQNDNINCTHNSTLWILLGRETKLVYGKISHKNNKIVFI